MNGRILGLDVGGKRIGVAVSDELGVVASPVGFIRRGPRELDELRDLIARFSAVQLVAGLPVGLSGREGPQAAEVRVFADAAAAAVALPLAYWDERLTSAMAERSLIASGTRRAKRREQIDAVAAAITLQGFLDHARFAEARGRGSGGR